MDHKNHCQHRSGEIVRPFSNLRENPDTPRCIASESLNLTWSVVSRKKTRCKSNCSCQFTDSSVCGQYTDSSHFSSEWYQMPSFFLADSWRVRFYCASPNTKLCTNIHRPNISH